MSGKLVSLNSSHNVQEYVDMHKKWELFHLTHTIHSAKNCEPINRLHIEPYVCNYSESSYTLIHDNKCLAFMSIDQHVSLECDNESSLIEIDDLLINPYVNWGYILECIIKTFQELNWSEIKITCNQMDHHEWLLRELKTTYNAFVIHMDDRFQKHNEYVIMLKDYQIKKFKHSLTITMKGCDAHTTPANIYEVSDSYFFHGCPHICKRSMSYSIDRPCTFRVVLFKHPLLIHYTQTYKERNNENYFELTIDGKKYKDCICSEEHPDISYCQKAFDCRRLNKIHTLKTTFGTGFSYSGRSYADIIYGIKVPRNIDESVCPIKCSEYSIQSDDRRYCSYIHIVPFSLSCWLHHFPRTLLKNGESLTKTNITLKKTGSCTPLTEIDEACINHGYIYLIQEREFYESKKNVYKCGKTCQPANNFITRLRSGYKKGSFIIGILSCNPEDTTEIENTVKARFAATFTKHTDGSEYFIGDPSHMMDIIYDTIRQKRSSC